MSCAVGAVFAASRADVTNLSAVFEEMAEHMFAEMRKFFKMFTVADIPILDDKVQRRITALVQHGIVSKSDSRYAAGSYAYANRNASMLQKQKESVNNKRQRTGYIANDQRRATPIIDDGINLDPSSSKSAAAQIAQYLLPLLAAASRGTKRKMRQLGFETHELSPLMEHCETLDDFVVMYENAMQNPERPYPEDDVFENESEATTGASSFINECLPDLFDNLLSLEKDNDAETAAAAAEALATPPLIESDDLSPPHPVEFLEAFIGEDIVMSSKNKLLSELAIAGLKACEVNTIGSRERGRVGTELQYKQLNVRWFGTSQTSQTKTSPILSELVDFRRNVLFEIDKKVYRVLTIYTKTYNKWLEIESVPLASLNKTQKVHARHMLEEFMLSD